MAGVKKADAMRDFSIRFEDTFEPGFRVVHARKNGKEGTGREPWPPPKDEKGHTIPRVLRPDSLDATQQAIDNLEQELAKNCGMEIP